MSKPNPLLESEELPAFSQIRPHHVVPALETLLEDGRASIDKLLDSAAPPSWDSLLQPLEDISDRMSRAWSPVAHLHAVADSTELRDAYNACLPQITKYDTELKQDPRLFRAFRSIEQDQAANDKLDQVQRKCIENGLRDFRLAGVDLHGQAKERFKELTARLAELSNQFHENVLDATQAWTKHVEADTALAGLPESARSLAREAAEREGLGGWLISLEFPSYLAVMTYADDRALRAQLYEAYATRASDRGPHAGRWDNGPIIEEIVALRHEQADLLEFENFAELSLQTKMAQSTQEVVAFLHDLAVRARPLAEAELSELREFAAAVDGIDDLQVWDVAYYSEKLREQQFSISEQALRAYFPLPRVLDGLFGVAQRLFGLHCKEERAADTWHPDVRLFAVYDEEGSVRGRCYIDLYARAHKRGGAWMDECVVRRRVDGKVQTPVAFVTCNFSPPVADEPAKLTHDEVLTLFHEFGHALHHMLSRVDHAPVSGINGVSWDAVELPSQLLENWCWDRSALQMVSGHHSDGHALPDAMLDKLLASRNFQAGLALLRQLEFALFDFKLHLDYQPDAPFDVVSTLDQIRAQVAVVTPPPFNRFASAFSHIFAGGYAAGYYSYLWAEVLSADVFEMFTDEGVLNSSTGRRFLHCILERGGSREAGELFEEFRGRAPDVGALLRQRGLE